MQTLESFREIAIVACQPYLPLTSIDNTTRIQINQIRTYGRVTGLAGVLTLATCIIHRFQPHSTRLSTLQWSLLTVTGCTTFISRLFLQRARQAMRGDDFFGCVGRPTLLDILSSHPLMRRILSRLPGPYTRTPASIQASIERLRAMPNVIIVDRLDQPPHAM